VGIPGAKYPDRRSDKVPQLMVKWWSTLNFWNLDCEVIAGLGHDVMDPWVSIDGRPTAEQSTFVSKKKKKTTHRPRPKYGSGVPL